MPVYYRIGDKKEGKGTIIFENGEKSKWCEHSDRLHQQDYEKYNKLCRKYFGNEGQSWSGREPKLIEQFLIDFTGRELVMTKIVQFENASNGYPYWRFDYYFKNDNPNV